MQSTALLLQKDFRQTFNGYFRTETLLTDVMVLTENTAQIAMGEKDSAGTPCAADGWFFPLVSGNKRYFWQRACATKANFARYTVSAAVSGTNGAVLQSLLRVQIHVFWLLSGGFCHVKPPEGGCTNRQAYFTMKHSSFL